MSLRILIVVAGIWSLLVTGTLALQRSDQPKTLTLSGKVVLEDGSPPPHQLQVELVCNGRVIQVAPTRTQGSFHFRLGEARRPTEVSAGTSGPDALEIGGRGLGGLAAGGVLRESGDGRYDLTNCEIRLPAHPNWQSNRILLGVQSIFEPDIGVIVLSEDSETRGTTVSVTSLAAPEDARQALEQARKALDRKWPNHPSVEKRLERAVDLYPEFAEAWNLLGEVRLQLNDPKGAREAFQRSAAADPDFIPPLLMLAGLELEEFRYQEALEFTAPLIALDPKASKNHYYHGLANYSLGQYDQAEASFEVIERNGQFEQFPAACLMLGDILARRGQVGASARQLRRYLEIGKHTPQMEQQLRRQLREWEEKGLIEKPGGDEP